VLACGLDLNLTSERVMLIGVLNLNWLTLSRYIIGVKIIIWMVTPRPVYYTVGRLILWVQIWGSD
jgi:hypothetical protein